MTQYTGVPATRQGMQSNGYAGSILALMGGIGAGIGLGLLLAPKAGHELRGDIKDSVRCQTDRIKTSYGEIKASSADLLEKGKQKVQIQAEGVKQALTAAQKAYSDVVAG